MTHGPASAAGTEPLTHLTSASQAAVTYSLQHSQTRDRLRLHKNIVEKGFNKKIGWISANRCKSQSEKQTDWRILHSNSSFYTHFCLLPLCSSPLPLFSTVFHQFAQCRWPSNILDSQVCIAVSCKVSLTSCSLVAHQLVWLSFFFFFFVMFDWELYLSVYFVHGFSLFLTTPFDKVLNQVTLLKWIFPCSSNYQTKYNWPGPLLPPLSFVVQVCVSVSCLWLPPLFIIPFCFKRSLDRALKDLTLLPHTLPWNMF